MNGRERYDRQITAAELKKGDEIHLTVMGGDEYFTITDVRPTAQDPDYIRWDATGVAEVGDIFHKDDQVWVKQR